VVLAVQQNSGNVVATATGSIDLTALNFQGTGEPTNSMAPLVGLIQVGSTPEWDVYHMMNSGPQSFGPGGQAFSTTQTGDFFGINNGDQIELPLSYVSGAPLSGTATWIGETITSLGLNPGTYIYTWGSGPTADTLTVNIGNVASVPEPASLWLAVIACVAVIAAYGWFAGSKKQRRESLLRPYGAAE
jgi:hypothetical protein